MTDPSEDSGQTALDVADRKMLAEIKANVLGTSREELRIGRFRVLDQLGAGAMGVVFAAADDQLQRRVAIKLLHTEVGASEDERRARLLREAKILAQLEHPNIVPVYEAGEHEGQLFMAMALVEGMSLYELQRERPAEPWRSLLPLYVAAGRGLAAAHAKGVVHRDFKPHNVLVDAKGRVRVVDFGLARESVGEDQQLTAEIELVRDGAIERPRGEHLTVTGVVPGTPAYMAPELFDGQPASPASDQFSFCVALYEAVYGRRPFEGTRVKEVVLAARYGKILPPPPGSAVPKWLFEVVSRGLSAKPEARYPSMEALLAELELDRARGWKVAGAGMAAAAVIGGTWWVSQPTVGDGPTLVHTDAKAAVQRQEAERQRTCRADAQRLRTSWKAAGESFARSPADQDPDGTIAVLDADAEPFFLRWEGICLDDAEGSKTHCLDDASKVLTAVIDDGMSEAPHENTFHDLIYELDLCAEGGLPSARCAGPGPGSLAATALTRARVAELEGHFDVAEELFDQAIASAEEEGEPLTKARAMLRKGAILESRGDVDSARRILQDAERYALYCGADVLALDAAIERAEVEILHDESSDSAKSALGFAEDLLGRQVGPLPLRRALLAEKRGGVELYLDHSCDTARPYFEEALALREQAIERSKAQQLPTRLHERLAADAEINLANVGYYVLTESTESCKREGYTRDTLIASHQAARRRMIAAVGSPHHPKLAGVDFDFGALLYALKDFPGAIESFESARAIFSAHHGPNRPIVGRVHRALSAVYTITGDLPRAAAHAAANVEIQRAHADGEGPQLALAEAHDALGLTQFEQDALSDARESFRLAIEALGPADLGALELNALEQLYMTEMNLGQVELARNDVAAARVVADRLREIDRAIEARTGEVHDDHPSHRIIEATVLIDEGKPLQALARLDGIEGHRDLEDVHAKTVERLRERATATR